ncbi:MAG: hypothetical protein WBJ13_00505 [Sedimentibacter sp.]
MDFTTIMYTSMILIVAFFVTTSFRNDLKYKKENMRILFSLNEDDKTTHLLSSLVIVILILFAGISIIGIINTKNYTNEGVLGMIIMPILLMVLYLPMMKKTRISSLGIHKKNYLIRWEDIKGINYLKPNAKDKIAVKILYNVGLKDSTVELTFVKDDEQLETFKDVVKQYRSTKKKDKKSGK